MSEDVGHIGEDGQATDGDIFFPTTVAMPDPEHETLNEYVIRSAAQGHYCCWCPQQDPPRPCCNPGHEEAVHRFYALEEMVRPSVDHRGWFARLRGRIFGRSKSVQSGGYARGGESDGDT